MKIIKVFAERLAEPEEETAISRVLEESDQVNELIKFDTPDQTGDVSPISEGIVTRM